MENRSTDFLVSNPDPEFTCYLRGRLYPQSTHEMLPTCSFRQVKYFRNLVLTFFYIILLTSPTLAFPKPKTKIKEEGENSVTIQVSGCRKRSNEDLRRMMGPAFDENKMAYDDVIDDATGNKRSSRKQSVIGRERLHVNEDLDDNFEDFFDDEDEVDELDDSETSDSSEQGGTISVQNRKYMRRKREATANDENTNNLSDKKFLYQNLLYDSITERKSRTKRSDMNHHHLTWECRKKDRWMKMKEGYFPSRIMEVKCKQKDCFFGMYTCNPVKYTVRVLKRDPENACNPVPLIGNSTVYEEVWQFKKIRVTVACECGYSRKATKWKNRNRSRG